MNGNKAVLPALLLAAITVPLAILSIHTARRPASRDTSPPAQPFHHDNAAAEDSASPPPVSGGPAPVIEFSIPEERAPHQPPPEQAPDYLWVGQYSEGLRAVELEDAFQYLDKEKNVAIVIDKMGLDTMHAGPFAGGLAPIWVDVYNDYDIAERLGFDPDDLGMFALNVFGLIDRSGEFVLPLRYSGRGDRLEWTEEGTMFVREFVHSGRWGVIDRSGKFLVEPRYELVCEADGIKAGADRYRFLQDGKWGFLNSRGEVVIQPVYEMAYDYEDGLAQVFAIYRYCVDLAHAQYFHEFYGMGDYSNLTVQRSLAIDTAGEVVSDDGRVRVYRHADGEPGVSATYTLPGYGIEMGELREISFRDMAVVRIPYDYSKGTYLNARSDGEGSWYLTEQYPSIYAYPDEVQPQG